MTDDAHPFTDNVNGTVRADWTDETTPFERVRTVMKRTYHPQSAGDIADRAETTSTTARKHLQQLADSGFVETTSTPEHEATLYNRSNESLVLEQARDILDRVDRDELATRVNEMHDDLQSYREEYGVESPEDAALLEADIDQETLQNWQTTRRNLGFAKVALALADAEDTVGAQPV